MNLTHRMTDRVWVAAVSGRSASGDPEFRARREVMARVERDTKNVRLPTGAERVSVATLYSHDVIRVGERCWLPGETPTDIDRSREVLRVQSADALSTGRTLYQAEV